MPTIVLVGLVVLLLYPPYFRGLYFPKEQLITLLYTLALFILWWGYKWAKGDLRFFGSTLDYFALAAALAWTVSIVVAVNPRGAIQEALKNINYFLVYWLVAEQIRSKDSILRGRVRPILYVMYLSAFGVALVGLGAAAGVVHYGDAMLSGRVSSTLQYPNTLASYLTAAFFIGLGLWASVQAPDQRPIVGRVAHLWKRFRTGAFATSLSLVLLTFIFTLSRGAWLVFPLALLLFIGLAGPGLRLRVGSYFVATLLAVAAAAPFMAKGVSAENARYVGLAVSMAVVLGALLGYLAEFYLLRPLKWKVLIAAGLTGLVAATGFTLAGLALAKPLALAHGADEKDSSKTFQQGLPDLAPGEEYVLELEVRASGDGSKPYAWRALISGFDAASGASKLLANLSGKPATDWEQKQVKFTVPEGVSRFSIQLLNYYGGTETTFRNASVRTTDGEVIARPIFALSKVLPNAIYRRLADFNLQTNSSDARLVFDKDALKIIRDNPVLGLGGRGWASAFMKYQSYGYISREVHNHFLQTWVDAGTVGFLAWMSLLGAVFYLGLRLIRQHENEGRIPWAIVVAAAAAILVHSIIDFNLSLSAISLYLWALAGVVASGTPLGKTPQGSVRSAVAIEAAVPIAVALVLVVLTGRLLFGHLAGAQAATLLQAQNPGQAKVLYERAISYDPWTSTYHMDLGQITGSLKELNRGISLEPLNPQYYITRGTAYFRQGNVKAGLDDLQRALDLEPYQQRGYEQVADLTYRIGESLYEAGKIDQPKPFLSLVLDYRDDLRVRAGMIPSNVPQAVRLNENAPNFALTLGRTQALLGATTDAVTALTFASRGKDTANEAALWLAAVHIKAGDIKKAEPFLAKIKAAGPEAEVRYANVVQMIRQQ